MRNIDAITQLAFEYIRQQNKSYSSPAEFLVDVNKLICQFADLEELDPSELLKEATESRKAS